MSDWQEIVGVLSGREVPLVLKAVYTAFVVLLVPIYWRCYGLANFLWFSDLALLITVPALWLESPLLASMQAVSVALLEMLWIADFLTRLTLGVHIIGMTAYMFKADTSRFLRGLSLFHLAIPFLLLWLVYRLGYDSRGLVAQLVFGYAVLLVCFFFTRPADNINWVFGPTRPQQRLAPGLYLAVLMAFFAVCVYLPTHFALDALWSR